MHVSRPRTRFKPKLPLPVRIVRALGQAPFTYHGGTLNESKYWFWYSVVLNAFMYSWSSLGELGDAAQVLLYWIETDSLAWLMLVFIVRKVLFLIAASSICLPFIGLRFRDVLATLRVVSINVSACILSRNAVLYFIINILWESITSYRTMTGQYYYDIEIAMRGLQGVVHSAVMMLFVCLTQTLSSRFAVVNRTLISIKGLKERGIDVETRLREAQEKHLRTKALLEKVCSSFGAQVSFIMIYNILQSLEILYEIGPFVAKAFYREDDSVDLQTTFLFVVVLIPFLFSPLLLLPEIDQVVENGNATIKFIHSIWNVEVSKSEMNQLELFAAQVYQWPVEVSFGGILTLRLGCLIEVLLSISGFAILGVQMTGALSKVHDEALVPENYSQHFNDVVRW